MNNYLFKSASELASLIRNREATSSAILQSHLEHIHKHNPRIGAIVVLLEEQAVKEAEACDREAEAGKFRGPLHGVPMTVKEQFWVKGTKSTLNSNRFKDWEAPEDALVVKRLKDAGAIIIGKTNVAKDLLDYQISGDIYLDGKNPYNPEYSPGGSSGGASAALASGMVPIELGGDMGGSIRIPSNFCGTYGLKPTENTIPGHGLSPKPKNARGYLFEMAVPGPMARTLDDLELLWTILQGPDKSNRSIPPIAWSKPEKKMLKDYKVGWVDSWPGYETSQQTKDTIRNFVSLLNGKGVETMHSPLRNDLHQRSLDVFSKLSFQMILQDVPWFVRPLMMWSLRRGFLKGMKTDFWKFVDTFTDYSELKGRRARIIEEWETHFDDFDFLVCPIGFGPAYKRCKIGTPIHYNDKAVTYINYVWPFNACFNGSGHPAMNIPLGLGKEGLPLGIQLVGRYWSEPDMLHFTKLVSKFIKGFVKPNGI
ncbi:amidase [Aquimarina rubra]|uniref:Amidase n=1 Tax=Aquimarina rubra TaxID=1920033 RepID=A0ABW5LLW9_9FLAO